MNPLHINLSCPCCIVRQNRRIANEYTVYPRADVLKGEPVPYFDRKEDEAAWVQSKIGVYEGVFKVFTAGPTVKESRLSGGGYLSWNSNGNSATGTLHVFLIVNGLNG